MDLAKDKFEVLSFSYIDDRGDLHENITLDEYIIEKASDSIMALEYLNSGSVDRGEILWRWVWIV